jgi:hypothetical protein
VVRGALRGGIGAIGLRFIAFTTLFFGFKRSQRENLVCFAIPVSDHDTKPPKTERKHEAAK